MSSEDKKTLIWKAFENQRVPWYNSVSVQVKNRFDQERDNIIALVKGSHSPHAALEGLPRFLSAERDSWKKFYQALYLNVSGDFAQTNHNNLKGLDLKAALPDGWQAIVTNYLRDNAGQKISYIEATTLDMLRSSLAEGVAQAEGTDLLSQRVADVYGSMRDYRSERIARTEVIGASNLGSRAGALETGLDLDHQWLSTRDSRTREDHVEMDGQTVPMDEPYT